MKNKLITATLLKGWASKRESQSIMPELIKRLIISSGAKVRKMSIPSGDNVYIPGWDGQVSSDSPIFNVSAGISLWEIGTNSDVTQQRPIMIIIKERMIHWGMIEQKQPLSL